MAAISWSPAHGYYMTSHKSHMPRPGSSSNRSMFTSDPRQAHHLCLGPRQLCTAEHLGKHSFFFRSFLHNTVKLHPGKP